MNDLLYTQGQDNLAGLVGEFLVCPTEDINTLPALAAATSLVTAASPIVCKVGKKFTRLYFTDETGKVDTNSVGERDGRGQETVLSGRYPKLTAALNDFVRKVQNTPLVIIYQVASTGKRYLLGVTQLDIASTALSLTIPCYFENSQASSGEKRPDQNGSLISFKFTCAHGPIEYAGGIETLLVEEPEPTPP